MWIAQSPFGETFYLAIQKGPIGQPEIKMGRKPHFFVLDQAEVKLSLKMFHFAFLISPLFSIR